jgi:hypothetical protein
VSARRRNDGELGGEGKRRGRGGRRDRGRGGRRLGEGGAAGGRRRPRQVGPHLSVRGREREERLRWADGGRSGPQAPAGPCRAEWEKKKKEGGEWAVGWMGKGKGFGVWLFSNPF